MFLCAWQAKLFNSDTVALYSPASVHGLVHSSSEWSALPRDNAASSLSTNSLWSKLYSIDTSRDTLSSHMGMWYMTTTSPWGKMANQSFMDRAFTILLSTAAVPSDFGGDFTSVCTNEHKVSVGLCTYVLVSPTIAAPATAHPFSCQWHVSGR
jgi:hypothetical protein